MHALAGVKQGRLPGSKRSSQCACVRVTICIVCAREATHAVCGMCVSVTVYESLCVNRTSKKSHCPKEIKHSKTVIRKGQVILFLFVRIA